MKRVKEQIDRVAKPAVPLILIGVLKGYIRNPIGFVIRAKLTFKTFKRTISLELPEDFIDSTGFIAHLYIRLKRRVGQEKAFEIIRAAVLVSGLAIQQAHFRTVEERRSFENLIENQQRANREGSTRLNTMNIIERSESRYEFHVTRCLFHELFLHLNVPELTQVICSIDNAIFNTYLPEKLTFHRNGLTNTIALGADHCEFVIENRDG
jgi:hypothetical protein